MKPVESTLHFLVILILSITGSLSYATNYQVQPSTRTVETHGLPTTTQWGIVTDGVATQGMGLAGQVNAGAATATRVITFSVTTVNTVIVFGWANSSSITPSNPIHGQNWFKPVPIGETSPWGTMANGKYYDPNGTEVDPDTGEEIDPEEGMAKAGIDLPSIFPDRPTEYQIMLNDAGTGELLGISNATAFPGASNHVNLTADRPFTYTWGPIIDGIVDFGLGGSGSSTGGNVANSGTPVINPPTISNNTPTVTQNPNPTAVSGSDIAAVKGAVDRLAGINLTGFNDNKVANGIINSQLDDLKKKLDTANTQLGEIADNTENEGTDGLTQAQVQAAVTDGINGVGVTGVSTDQTAMTDGIAEKTGFLSSVSSTSTAFGNARSAGAGLATALGLGTSYSVVPLTFAISLGPFGSSNIDLEQYSTSLDFIRLITLFMMSIYFVKQYFIIIRNAAVG